MSDQAFDIRREDLAREGNLLSQCHLEHLICVLVHERGSAIDQLIDKDSKSVPVGCPAMPNIEDDLRGDVLWCATESVGAIPRLQPLDEAKVCELEVAILSDKHILWLKVSVDQILPMQVLKHENYLSCVKLYKMT